MNHAPEIVTIVALIVGCSAIVYATYRAIKAPINKTVERFEKNLDDAFEKAMYGLRKDDM